MDTDTDQISAAPEAATEVSLSTETSVDNSSLEASGNESTGEAAAPALPAYKADYKIKVYDEDQELSDPFLKELIKDQESEKKVKEIAQKFLGFDKVKEKLERSRVESQEYQKQAQPVIEYYNHAEKLLQKGDLEGFFDLVKIPDQMIFQYAIQKAEQTPEQRAYMEQQRAAQKQTEYLQSQNQTLMTEKQQLAVQNLNQELNWALARPDVASVANVYDQKVSKPGAFRQMVIDKGIAHSVATQGREHLTVEQATQEVMKYIGVLVQPTMSSGVQPTPGNQQLIQQNAQPPVIPAVSGRSGSPVKKQVRSLDDIKKRQSELSHSS